MKKLVSAIAIFFVFMWIDTASAQVCKINGTNDNVEIFDCYIDKANQQVIVIVSNDSQNISANVTVNVEIKGYSGCSGCKESLIGKGLAKPNQSTEIKIKVPNTFKADDKTSTKCTGISGTKCL